MRSLPAVAAAILALCAAPALAADAPTFTYPPAPPAKPAGVVVMPAKPAAKMPAILWVHWLGEPETTNHTEFLADANALAERGVVSLLVDMPWSQQNWFTAVRAPERDYDDVVAQVVSLRRALDYVTSLPGVDPARIAYVGHDFGAMDGALLLAVDDRPKFAVLMAPTLSFWEWDLLGAQPADRAAYVAQMSAFDLPGWLAKGKQSATLLQFATKDDYVANATASALRNAVPERGRTFKRYDTGHALELPAAHADRRSWLLARFDLPD